MSTQLSPIESFNQGFNGERNRETLKKYLADEDLQDRFTAVVTRAVQENPDLLQADRKSLFYACQKAAQDKLMPDGKEGFLSVYNTNAGTKQSPNWIKKVQWQPMILGLRKILANAGFTIRAEIVYEKDEFFYELGDAPTIIHRPKMFGDRGEIIGAYAIATDKNGNNYREVMDLLELEKVHMASKQPNSNVWKLWLTEMYRKAVAKRLFKQLPLSDSFMEVITRDNRQFDMNKKPEASATAKSVQEHVRLEAPNNDAKLESVPAEEPIAVPVEREEELQGMPASEERYASEGPDGGWPEEESMDGRSTDPYNDSKPGPNEPDF